MSQGERRTLDDLDRAIRGLAEQPPAQAAADLTAIANRAIIELNKVARSEASRHRGESDWGSWARLANAARSAVLQVAAVRDSLKSLGVKSTASPEAPAPEEASS